MASIFTMCKNSKLALADVCPYTTKGEERAEAPIFHLEFTAIIINKAHSLHTRSALYYGACALRERSQTMILATATPLFTSATVSRGIIPPSLHAHPPLLSQDLLNLQRVAGISDFGLVLDKIEEEARRVLQRARCQLAKARRLSADNVDELERTMRDIQVDQVKQYHTSFADSLIQCTPYSLSKMPEYKVNASFITLTEEELDALCEIWDSAME